MKASKFTDEQKAFVIYSGDNGSFGVLDATYEGESFVNNSNSGGPTFLHNAAAR